MFCAVCAALQCLRVIYSKRGQNLGQNKIFVFEILEWWKCMNWMYQANMTTIWTWKSRKKKRILTFHSRHPLGLTKAQDIVGTHRLPFCFVLWSLTIWYWGMKVHLFLWFSPSICLSWNIGIISRVSFTLSILCLLSSCFANTQFAVLCSLTPSF